jgi:hypothetical protein
MRSCFYSVGCLTNTRKALRKVIKINQPQSIYNNDHQVSDGISDIYQLQIEKRELKMATNCNLMHGLFSS